MVMKHRIDPLVDCVFKALLGSEENRNLLIHFLNAVTGFQGDDAITDVIIMNPYNEEKFFAGKFSVVDIKAKCQNELKYQIEVQLARHRALESRILHNWSAMYHADLKKGEAYAKLKPTVSIWVLDLPLFPETSAYHLVFRPYDVTNGLLLSDHMTIHLLQLPKFETTDTVANETERWLYFFRRAAYLESADDLPPPLQTKEMIQAMNTLVDFSEDEKRFLLYQSRLDELSTLSTWKEMIEEALREKEQAKKELENKQRENEQAQREKEQAQREKEKALKKVREYAAILKEKGVDVDEL